MYIVFSFRHMSKHERQHSTSHVADVTSIESKRARLMNMNSNYSAATDPDENKKINDEKASFSTCFLTDKILMPQETRSIV